MGCTAKGFLFARVAVFIFTARQCRPLSLSRADADVGNVTLFAKMIHDWKRKLIVVLNRSCSCRHVISIDMTTAIT